MDEVNKSIGKLRRVRDLVLNIASFKYIYRILTNRALNPEVYMWRLLTKWSMKGATKISPKLLKAKEMKGYG